MDIQDGQYGYHSGNRWFILGILYIHVRKAFLDSREIVDGRLMPIVRKGYFENRRLMVG